MTDKQIGDYLEEKPDLIWSRRSIEEFEDITFTVVMGGSLKMLARLASLFDIFASSEEANCLLISVRFGSKSVHIVAVTDFKHVPHSVIQRVDQTIIVVDGKKMSVKKAFELLFATPSIQSVSPMKFKLLNMRDGTAPAEPIEELRDGLGLDDKEVFNIETISSTSEAKKILEKVLRTGGRTSR